MLFWYVFYYYLGVKRDVWRPASPDSCASRGGHSKMKGDVEIPLRQLIAISPIEKRWIFFSQYLYLHRNLVSLRS